MITTTSQLLARLARDGGCIVSSNDCSRMEIADAQAHGRMFVDADGLGYVLRTKAWLERVHARDGYSAAA